MAAYYQIRSPLSQVTDDYMDSYIAAVSAAVGEDFTKVSLEDFLSEDFDAIYKEGYDNYLSHGEAYADYAGKTKVSHELSDFLFYIIEVYRKM